MTATPPPASSQDALFDHDAALRGIPAEPGVYLMKDRRGEIVYVGKAKELKTRVRSYFSGSDTRPFVRLLPRMLGAIDVMITRNEKEALILENTLIKRHQPRFNLALRDDKEFLRLRIDPNEPWPWARIVRRERSDGARYFGPYHSASACREALRVLNRHFMLRTCTDSVLNNRSRPCLQYQIKRCPGPCVLPVDREAYLENVRAAMLFLDGKSQELVTQLEARMHAAAAALDFERAARLRDQVRAVSKLLERQQVSLEGEVDQDVFGLYREGERVCVQVLYIRSGRLQGGDAFHFEDALSDDARILSQLLMRHYSDGALVPPEVVVPIEVESAEALAEVLSDQRGARTRLVVPKRGGRRELVLSAIRNAQQQFGQHNRAVAASEAVLEAMMHRLGLGRLPRRIECFDISNLQGGAIVASMVVFVDGQPARSQYRTYKIRDLEGQDDFGAMFEVITRRYRSLAEGDEAEEEVLPGVPGSEVPARKRSTQTAMPVPDLVVIDGGKGQLNAALQAIDELGVGGAFDIISLAKARTSRDMLDPEVRHSPERVFFPGAREPLVLPQDTETIFLLQQVRDEAHRVAIGFHRKVRGKRSLRSRLDAVPGIGPRRKAALLKHFGSLERLKTATVDEIATVQGMTRLAAQRVHEFLTGPDAAEGDVVSEG